MYAMFSTAPTPIIEFCECTLKPASAMAYLDATAQAAELRKSLLPLRFFSMPDTGGQLNIATHAYYYVGGHMERDAGRTQMTRSPAWQRYLEKCGPFLQEQKSQVFVESPLVEKFEEIQGLSSISEANVDGSNGILEIRRYNLILGYDTVPNFMKLYEGGLPSKLSAQGTDPTTSLITLLYSEVGRLNEVIEIWRHGDGTAAMERSRAAARGATPWRTSIAKIAPLAVEFTSTIHKPASFSPL